ncbi:MAG: anhydro-N-acetylmuramic acid kinase AnmK, partial [Fusobacteriaceae bacterium]
GGLLMKKYGIGLMSGTSLDGVDVVLLGIEGSGSETKIETLAFDTYDIPKEIENKIKSACSIEESNSELICSLNFELGYLFAEAVKKLCDSIEFPLEKLDFIGSHGQTIWHTPFKTENSFASTLQIGEPAVIAFQTKTLVVSNFRTMDMAAGGQGAPLVPFTEYLLFASKEKGRIFQNIGGIGNLTLIPTNCSLDQLEAFDTGPGNMIIDEFCKIFKNVSYDKDGKWASEGEIQKDILDFMKSSPYLDIKPPKSTGREIYGAQYVKEILEKFPNRKAEDYISTATMFTAYTIWHQYEKFIFNRFSIDEIIIAGGGSYNHTLMQFIKELLKDKKVMTGEEFGINSSAKEAIAFAILANETLHGNPSNTPAATGAKDHVLLGNITKI